MIDQSTRVPWLFVILALALTLRAGAAAVVQNWVSRTPGRLCLIAGDAEGYWELAGKLTRGEGYAIYVPPRYVERMPGFPMLLAGGMLVFGERPLPLRLMLAIVGTVACGLVYWLGIELFDRGTALVACLVAAISPPLILITTMFLSETLFATTLLLSLVLMAQLVRRGRAAAESAGRFSQRSAWLSVATGAAIGAATLVRPTWLLVGPAFAAIYWAWANNKRSAARDATFVLLGLTLALAPWTIRNAIVTGHFVPTTLWAGPSLYDGLNPGATGASDMQFIEHDRIYERLPEYEADKYYRRAAIDYARENPRRAVELALCKLGRFWSLIPHADPFGRRILRWGMGAWTVTFFGAVLVGLWQSRRNFWQWLLPVAPVAYFSLLHLAFVGSVRYRLPAEYPLCLLASAGLLAVARRLPFGFLNPKS